MKPLRLFPPLFLAIAAIAVFANQVQAGEVVRTGWWSQYAEAPTLAQIDYHGFSIDDAEGFIAVLNCDRVGQFAWIKVNDSGWFRVRVFDCLGANGNPAWWRENNVLGEIDYYTAVSHGVEGQGGVRAALAFESDLEGNFDFLDLDLNPGPALVDEATELDSGNELGAIILDEPTDQSVDVGFISDVLSVDGSVLEPDGHANLNRLVENESTVWINSAPYRQMYPISFLLPFGPVNAGPVRVPALWSLPW